MSDVTLIGNTDAKAWAEEFVHQFEGHVCGENDTIDEEIMVVWFANAIMTGYDIANNRKAGNVPVGGASS